MQHLIPAAGYVWHYQVRQVQSKRQIYAIVNGTGTRKYNPDRRRRQPLRPGSSRSPKPNRFIPPGYIVLLIILAVVLTIIVELNA